MPCGTGMCNGWKNVRGMDMRTIEDRNEELVNQQEEMESNMTNAPTEQQLSDIQASDNCTCCNTADCGTCNLCTTGYCRCEEEARESTYYVTVWNDDVLAEITGPLSRSAAKSLLDTLDDGNLISRAEGDMLIAGREEQDVIDQMRSDEDYMDHLNEKADYHGMESLEECEQAAVMRGRMNDDELEAYTKRFIPTIVEDEPCVDCGLRECICDDFPCPTCGESPCDCHCTTPEAIKNSERFDKTRNELQSVARDNRLDTL